MPIKVYETYRIPNKLDQKEKPQILSQIILYHIIPERKTSSEVTVHILLDTFIQRVP